MLEIVLQALASWFTAGRGWGCLFALLAVFLGAMLILIWVSP
jgi:hypothetical protein